MARETTQQSSQTAAAVTLAAAHARLAQWALTVYVGTAIIVTSLLVAALVTEKTHAEDQLEATLRSATVDRSYALRRYLDLLSAELSRLASRSEIETADNDNSPERKLLELAHKRSSLFDVGVAILDQDGSVVWAEPRNFLSPGTSFRAAPWFEHVADSPEVRIVPVAPERKDSLLYLVAPAMRDDNFVGVVLGAIDLSHRHLSSAEGGLSQATTLITTDTGEVIYPPVAPDFARDPKFRSFFKRSFGHAESARLVVQQTPSVVAACPIPGTDLIYALRIPEDVLFGRARSRMYLRMVMGLLLVVPPLWMLVLVLRRGLRVFRQSEQEAVERERLQLLADASNLIAHEVRNALNGLGVGLDLLLQGQRAGQANREERVVRQLRDEMHRLSDFTGELMLFSKGIVPHPVKIDLSDTVPKLTELSLDIASEAGCAIDVRVEKSPVWAYVDPALLRVVLSNLIGNALDVLSSKPEPGHVSILLGASEQRAEVRVADDGPGVPPDFRTHLFEPFRTTKPSGTGLGLALSRKIARAHGGDLVLEDSPKGASFLLTLPSEAP